MRTTEAAQCNVRSVLLLPLFGDPQRSSTIGVVEVAQSTDKMPFGNVVSALSAAFKVRFGDARSGNSACHLRTVKFGPSLAIKLSSLHVILAPGNSWHQETYCCRRYQHKFLPGVNTLCKMLAIHEHARLMAGLRFGRTATCTCARPRRCRRRWKWR